MNALQSKLQKSMSKLVRDRIPEIIEKAGEEPITHIADDVEYWESLKDKLQEEILELCEATTPQEETEEMADVMEVIRAICKHKGIDLEELEQVRQKKEEDRGGFYEKIIRHGCKPKSSGESIINRGETIKKETKKD